MIYWGLVLETHTDYRNGCAASWQKHGVALAHCGLGMNGQETAYKAFDATVQERPDLHDKLHIMRAFQPWEPGRQTKICF
jgi:hypothetical protein